MWASGRRRSPEVFSFLCCLERAILPCGEEEYRRWFSLEIQRLSGVYSYYYLGLRLFRYETNISKLKIAMQRTLESTRVSCIGSWTYEMSVNKVGRQLLHRIHLAIKNMIHVPSRKVFFASIVLGVGPDKTCSGSLLFFDFIKSSEADAGCAHRLCSHVTYTGRGESPQKPQNRARRTRTSFQWWCDK